MVNVLKENYLNSNDNFPEDELFQKDIFALRDKHNIKINKNKIGFLILDMQRFFFEKSSHAFIPSGGSIIDKIKEIKNVCIKSSVPVIQTRHINNDENSKQMGKWWRDILKREDNLSKIIDDIGQEDVITVEKSQYNAFFNSALEDILKEKGISQILIGGVMTHLCCETTAREAFVRGFEVFFGMDFTATYNRKFHFSTLLNLSHGFAYPIYAKEAIEHLK